jgi:hypothetical protein
VVYNESKGYAFSAYTADQMRAYARAAQAQPAASGEPVAWTYTGIKADGSEHGPHLVWNPAYMDAMSASKGAQATPLYAAPQPAPAPADIAASGEPVAWQWSTGGTSPWIQCSEKDAKLQSAWPGVVVRPLYTAQPAPAPLTDEQIDRITTEQWGRGLGAPYAAYRAYARAIEAAHGIGTPAKEAP